MNGLDGMPGEPGDLLRGADIQGPFVIAPRGLDGPEGLAGA